MKKLLKIAFVFLLLFESSIQIMFADEETVYTEGNLQYTINDNNTIEVAYYYGRETEFTVPWTIGAYQVEDFRDGAFNSSDVTTIRVPDYLYDYASETPKINIRSYNPGTMIIFYDAFGNDKVNYDSTIRNVVSENDDEPQYEEFDPSKMETIDSTFEDQTVILGDDVFDNTPEEAPQNFFIKTARRIRDAFLYNGSQFASNFAKNPVGYIIIIVSVAALIYLLVRYLRGRRR